MTHDPAIYRYCGGPEAPEKFADPLAVLRKIRTLLGGDGSAVLAAYQGSDPLKALDAAERFHAAIAYAFGVTPFDPGTGQGLTEDKLIALWNDFQDWLKKKQSSSETSPTSSPPMAGSTAERPLPKRNSVLSSMPAGNRPVSPGLS